MANLLYGVNGEGAGHSTRAKEVISHLQQRGHAVHIVSFDRGLVGKPYLAIPVAHQFEQIFNANWLEKAGYGAYWEGLNKERVESFLYNLPHFREKLVSYPRQGNDALLAKLDALIAQLTNSSRGRN